MESELASDDDARTRYIRSHTRHSGPWTNRLRLSQKSPRFQHKVLYYDVIRRQDFEKEYDIRFTDIDQLFKEADFVTINTPLTKETHHLVDEKKLKSMKKTAYLINNARGPIVDEKALYKALKQGWIAGAGLDVFEQEPTPLDNPLLKLDNVVVAPHISSASYETRSKMAEMVADNLIAYFEGRTPPNLVNAEVAKQKKT
jgi:glyoxylate reductase